MQACHCCLHWVIIGVLTFQGSWGSQFVMKAVNIPPDLLITTKCVFLHTNCSSKSADGTDFLRFSIFIFSVWFYTFAILKHPNNAPTILRCCVSDSNATSRFASCKVTDLIAISIRDNIKPWHTASKKQKEKWIVYLHLSITRILASRRVSCLP